MISVVLALLTSASNATAAVLQRRAASQARSSRPLGLGLIGDLIHRRVWLAGIGMVIVAALLQAGALATGPIALVQPIFIVELPLTLLLSSWVWHRRLAPRTWGAVALVTVSLGTGLAAAQPSGGVDHAPIGTWILALIATGCFEAALIVSALRVTGEPRAALLGLAAACGYALTAAFLKEAVAALDQGPVAFFETWQLYGTAIAGVGALFLLQNALQAGTLAASQPMLTVGDALISITYGVMLFGETLRLGWFLIPEIVALVLIVVGYIEIAKSPVATAHDEGVAPSPPVTVAERASHADASHAAPGRPGAPTGRCAPGPKPKVPATKHTGRSVVPVQGGGHRRASPGSGSISGGDPTAIIYWGITGSTRSPRAARCSRPYASSHGEPGLRRPGGRGSRIGSAAAPGRRRGHRSWRFLAMPDQAPGDEAREFAGGVPRLPGMGPFAASPREGNEVSALVRDFLGPDGARHSVVIPGAAPVRARQPADRHRRLVGTRRAATVEVRGIALPPHYGGRVAAAAGRGGGAAPAAADGARAGRPAERAGLDPGVPAPGPAAGRRRHGRYIVMIQAPSDHQPALLIEVAGLPLDQAQRRARRAGPAAHRPQRLPRATCSTCRSTRWAGSSSPSPARPALGRDDVVLPAAVLARVERHALGVAGHRDALLAAGQHLKRGLLLYGPPGTGKTHTTRYLLGQMTGYTRLVLTGRSLVAVAAVTDLARALQPAVVVLEDVDLVAEERSHRARHPARSCSTCWTPWTARPRTPTCCSC